MLPLLIRWTLIKNRCILYNIDFCGPYKFKNRKTLTESDNLILRIFIATKIRKMVHRTIFMHLHNVHVSVLAEMTLELFVPFFHSVDLVFVVSLTRASWEISVSPLAKTSGQLFDTFWWIFTVVSVKFGITLSLFSFSLPVHHVGVDFHHRIHIVGYLFRSFFPYGWHWWQTFRSMLVEMEGKWTIGS